MSSPHAKPQASQPGPAADDGLRFLRLALLIIVAGVSCYGLLLFSLAPEQYYRSVGPLLLLPVALIAFLLLRRGSTAAALSVLCYGVWAAVTVAAVFAGGVRAPALATYPLLIVMAGWLLGLRTGIVMACLALSASGLFALAESADALPHIQPAPPLLIWLVQAIVYATAAVLIALVLHRYEQRYRVVQQLGEALSVRVSELAARETELRLLTENIPAMIGAFEGMICRFANRRYAEFFGFTPENIVGRPLSGILGEEATQAMQDKLQAALAGETVRYRVMRRSAADGREYVLDISFVPERDEAGAVAGFYALKLDVTAEVRAEDELRRSEDKFAKVFRSSPLAVAVTRLEDGRYLDVNDALVRMFGWSRDEIIGRTSLDIGKWPYPGERDEMVATLKRDGRISNRDVRLRDKHGGIRQALLSAELIALAGEQCALVMVADITERKRAEEMFAKVFQASPIAISISRLRDGRYLDVNEAFAKQFGWSREEMIGRNSVDIGIWPNEAERNLWIAELGAAGRARSRETVLNDKAGRRHIVLVSAERFDLDDEPHVIGLVHDITEHRLAEIALRDSEARLKEAQRIGHVGSWSLDLATRSMLWSDELYRMLDSDARTFGGTWGEFLAMVHPDDQEPFRQARRAADTPGRSYEIESRIVTHRGRVRRLHMRWEVFFDADGKPVRALGTARDITEAAQARAEIERLNAELETRVEERTAELTAANRELESFAYSISHDLRAPLRGIDGFSHLLAEEYGARLDDTGRSYLERVRRAAQRMGHLIDDILELSRVTRQEMRRVRVDLSQIAAEIIEERARAEPGHRVAVSIAPDCTAHGDPQLLRVLMQNLIENAWKYSARQPAPSIEFGRETIDGESVFFVRDNGVGFDMKYADRLFTPFQRLHKPEEFEGTGIGLATVARIVRRHGGRVWIEAATGKGTTARFSLVDTPDKSSKP